MNGPNLAAVPAVIQSMPKRYGAGGPAEKTFASVARAGFRARIWCDTVNDHDAPPSCFPQITSLSQWRRTLAIRSFFECLEFMRSTGAPVCAYFQDDIAITPHVESEQWSMIFEQLGDEDAVVSLFSNGEADDCHPDWSLYHNREMRDADFVDLRVKQITTQYGRSPRTYGAQAYLFTQFAVHQLLERVRPMYLEQTWAPIDRVVIETLADRYYTVIPSLVKHIGANDTTLSDGKPCSVSRTRQAPRLFWSRFDPPIRPSWPAWEAINLDWEAGSPKRPPLTISQMP